MVMPIVEAVLQELINAEEEQLVAGTSSPEEAELMGTVRWSLAPLCSSALLPGFLASLHSNTAQPGVHALVFISLLCP